MIDLTFEKSAAQFVIDAFPGKKRVCTYCGKKITPENLGGVVGGDFVCTHIECILDLAAELQRDALGLKYVS